MALANICGPCKYLRPLQIFVALNNKIYLNKLFSLKNNLGKLHVIDLVSGE